MGNWSKEKRKEYNKNYRKINNEKLNKKDRERYWKNKEKKNKLTRKYWKANSEKMHKARLWYAYKITAEDYDIMFAKQKGCCAICGRHQKELVKGLCVDHNHKTGKIRGLLCTDCNIGIGMFKDDLEMLQRAVKYLS